MKRPVVKKRNLREFYRNKPLLTRGISLVYLLLSPILGTYYLWKEYGNEVTGEIVYAFKVAIGKWED